jgi:hypothetical protein
MAAKQDIAAAAEAHTVLYIAELVSPTHLTSTLRATKMASYYLPNITSFAGGSITQVSDSVLLTALIVSTLEKLETDKGMLLEEMEHRVDVLGEGSAIVWITWKRKELVWTNVHFFRRTETGSNGWEGGIFDGEVWVMKKLAEE